MVAKKKVIKEEYFWEIVAPEPFIIDTEVSDEQFISEMVSVSNSEEITDLIHSYLQGPTKSFIVYCSEYELKKILNISGKGFKTKLEKDGPNWCISIIDDEGAAFGHGEVLKLPWEIDKSDVKDIMTDHLSDFVVRYDKGNTRIKSLMYKMEYIKSKMNTGSTVLS